MEKEIYLGPKLKFNEKLAYGLGELPNAMVSVLGAFLTLFYTDKIGLLPGVVGTMFFISKLLDGISDLIAGTIVDHTRSKWGKARPWLLWLSVPTGLALALIFFVPQDTSPTAQLIYAFVTYNLYNTVLFTMVGCAKNALMALMTQRAEDRMSLSKYNTLLGLGCVMVATSVTLPFINKMGGNVAAWRIVFVVYGIITALALLFAFANSKEHVQAVEATNKSTEKTVNFFEALKMFIHNKYFVFALAIFFGVQFSTQINSVTQTYFYIYSMNDESLVSVMNIVSLIPMIIGVIVLPDIMLKKFGKKKMACIGAGVHLITSLIIALSAALGNIPLMIVATVLKNFSVGAISVPVGILSADAVDYGEYLTNKRLEGVGNAVITFGQKLSTGLAAGVLGWVLQLTGYTANQVQNVQTILGINILFCYLPAIIFAVIILSFKFVYHYDEEEAEVLAELAKRKQNQQ